PLDVSPAASGRNDSIVELPPFGAPSPLVKDRTPADSPAARADFLHRFRKCAPWKSDETGRDAVFPDDNEGGSHRATWRAGRFHCSEPDFSTLGYGHPKPDLPLRSNRGTTLPPGEEDGFPAAGSGDRTRRRFRRVPAQEVPPRPPAQPHLPG